MKKVLVLDPAKSTGYCVIHLFPEQTRTLIIAYGNIQVTVTDGLEGQAYLDLETKVKQLIDQYQPESIAMECYFMSGADKFGGCNLNVGFRAILQTLACRFSMPYEMLNISQWKKSVALSSRPSAAQIEKWGKTAANKLFIQQALFERFNIRFPEYCVSPESGRVVQYRSDAMDAVGMATFVAETKGCPVIINHVQENLELPQGKKPPKGAKRAFSYEDLPSSIKTPVKKKKT